ncbi:ABC transporter permease [Spiroplasma endosymbiont of Crioceris asparagi]|uniref:ABC transporter permease n=1 Tax=Spiroplasma endosymbiont of Crioceris asparagi TaxID=3066286 RepID=UPI0030D57674
MLNNKWDIFKDMMKFQWKNNLRNMISVFTGLFVTIILLFTWLTFKVIVDKNDSNKNMELFLQYDPFILSSAIGISTIINCFLNMARIMHEFKIKNFFRRTFATNISKKFLIICMVAYNQMFNMIVSLLLFLFAMCYVSQRDELASVNWLIFIGGYLLLACICNLFGIYVAFAVKRFDMVLIVTNAFYYASTYFLGLGIPYGSLINQNSKIMLWISYIFPQKYPLSIMQAGWQGHFGFDNMKQQTRDEIGDIGIGYWGHNWIPFVVTALLFLFAMLLLRWIIKSKYKIERTNNYEKYARVSKESANKIYLLERATTIEELKRIKESQG